MEGPSHRRREAEAGHSQAARRNARTEVSLLILLDSDIIIDYLKDRQPARSCVERLVAEGIELATSSLNVVEVLRGTFGSRIDAAHAAALHTLGGLRELPFGPRAARRCARLMATLDRAGQPVPVVDAMIASIALEAGCPIVTGNTKDFEPIEGLVVRTADA